MEPAPPPSEGGHRVAVLEKLPCGWVGCIHCGFILELLLLVSLPAGGVSLFHHFPFVAKFHTLFLSVGGGGCLKVAAHTIFSVFHSTDSLPGCLFVGCPLRVAAGRALSLFLSRKLDFPFVSSISQIFLYACIKR